MVPCIISSFTRREKIMTEKYMVNQALIAGSDMTAVSAMKGTPAETYKSILSRIGIEYMDNLPAEAYQQAFYDALCEEPELVLQMLSGNIIELLIAIWENDQLEIEEMQWDIMRYLSMFGFVSCRRGNFLSGEPNVIYWTQDMKDRFYFYLKSRKSKTRIEEYEEWQWVLEGQLFYYGVLEMDQFHQLFCSTMDTMISYETFTRFLKGRCALWPWALLLRAGQSDIEYVQYTNAENVERILGSVESQSEVPYYQPDKQVFRGLAESGDLDKSWDGMADMARLLAEDLQMDYYRVTVMMRSITGMIKNGAGIEKLKENLKALPLHDTKQKEQAESALLRMYESIPIYELKGYNRREYQKMFHQKELKKRRRMFTMIKGGRGLQ